MGLNYHEIITIQEHIPEKMGAPLKNGTQHRHMFRSSLYWIHVTCFVGEKKGRKIKEKSQKHLIILYNNLYYIYIYIYIYKH